MDYVLHRYSHSDEIVKIRLNEFWLCHVQKSKAKVLFEQENHKMLADNEALSLNRNTTPPPFFHFLVVRIKYGCENWFSNNQPHFFNYI